jgi:branched-chain amino acid transport system ATP-binding protein
MKTLDLHNVGRQFIGLQALEDVSFSVQAGELVALIGPNGAGKSTLINVVSGDLVPSAGTVTFAGRKISGLAPHDINARGLTRTYQAVETFAALSVLDNVMVGGVRRVGLAMTETLFKLGSARRKNAQLLRFAREALAAVGLEAHADTRAASLSAGQQRLLAIARALATGGEWLILDEPGAGLNQVEKKALAQVIRALSANGKTILFVEHDMELVGNLARRVIVLDRGRLIAEGTPQSVRQSRDVIDAYLGVPQVVRREVVAAAPRADGLMLEVNDLVVRYGVNAALKHVTLKVPERSIVAVVGPNGAGKSTLLKAIIRALPIASGEIKLAGQSTGLWTTRAMVKAGVALAPEGRELFASLTVMDNLRLGAYTRRSAWLGRPLSAGSARAIDRVFTQFPRLAERRSQLAGTLSGGEGQMLAIGRALMNEPRLLMLDEPSLGLAPMVVAEILKTLLQLCADGLTILLVEQNARAALEISDRGYIIETGNIVAEDEAKTLLASPEIAAAYLGGPTTSSLIIQT